ncbi:MAG: spore cortex-lytic enzyme [Clostridia bacterium]|nr:spore cortex-lytic enzyme [Clostridia bacterium]
MKRIFNQIEYQGAGNAFRRVLALVMVFAFVLTIAIVFLPSSDGVAEAVVLKQGSTGTLVKTMQTKLIRWGYLQGTADGVFGPKTKAAVILFQKRNGLVADGVVGTKTAQAMGLNLNSTTTSSSSSTSSTELNLLAHVVYGEARGEPYTGQVAVAAVVLNRVKSSSFPNTIAGVIYQAGAFDCVSDGQINLSPNQTAINAARDALNGWDPTYGCLFYYNPKTATSKWMLSRTVKLSIGNHNFC